MIRALLLAALAATPATAQMPYRGDGDIFTVTNPSGFLVVSFKQDRTMDLSPWYTPEDAARQTAREIAVTWNLCDVDNSFGEKYSFVMLYKNAQNDHDHFEVALKTNGSVTYDNIAPTEDEARYFATLADLWKCQK